MMATTAADLMRGFQQTDDMRAADEEVRNSTPETEPENWTYVGSMGWVYTGKRARDTTATKKATWLNRKTTDESTAPRRQHITGSLGWHRNADLLELAAPGEGSGWGNFTKDSWARLREATGSNYNPLIDTHPGDHKAILKMYKNPDWNPYVDRSVMNQPVREGSVADVLYGLMKNDRKNRYSVYRATRGIEDMGNTRMTSQIWNDAGLNEVLGDYNERTGGGVSAFDYIRNGSGMMSGLNNLPKIQNTARPAERRQRTGTWGAGHGLFSEENSAMRSLIADNLEKKLLG